MALPNSKRDVAQRQAWHHLTASVTLLNSKRDVTQQQAWHYLTAGVTLLNGRRDTEQAKNRELGINRLQEHLI
ncbi:MAG: hypothetical protein LBC19_02355 [Tannerella sp.]|nr:hypothetical protein [Tannerella sp.]